MPPAFLASLQQRQAAQGGMGGGPVSQEIGGFQPRPPQPQANPFLEQMRQQFAARMPPQPAAPPGQQMISQHGGGLTQGPQPPPQVNSLLGRLQQLRSAAPQPPQAPSAGQLNPTQMQQAASRPIAQQAGQQIASLRRASAGSGEPRPASRQITAKPAPRPQALQSAPAPKPTGGLRYAPRREGAGRPLSRAQRVYQQRRRGLRIRPKSEPSTR